MPTTHKQIKWTVSAEESAWLTANIPRGKVGKALREALKALYPDFPADLPARGTYPRRTQAGSPATEADDE